MHFRNREILTYVKNYSTQNVRNRVHESVLQELKIEDNIIGALADRDFKKLKNSQLKVSDELRVKIEKIDVDKRRMTFNIVPNNV